MYRFVLFFFIALFVSSFSLATTLSKPEQPINKKEKQQLLGSPVYIQIFKEERVLELYGKLGHQFRLLDRYPVCNFSGGLGPKQMKGDFKSPEGFYQVNTSQLKLNSKFYRAINLGFPNQYDRYRGYNGDYLMIHGNCVSVGCYAIDQWSNGVMDEIFAYVNAALRNGQSTVNISIYPFRMTKANMQRHKNSSHFTFWNELQPGFEWFEHHKQPPNIIVYAGKYQLIKNSVFSSPTNNTHSFLTLSKAK